MADNPSKRNSDDRSSDIQRGGSKSAAAPKLTVSNAMGDEDTAIVLAISATATDANETLSVLISGLPDGASLSAGKRIDERSYLLSASQLVGLTLTPPADFEGKLHLQITAIATQGSEGQTASAQQALDVIVNPVAETPLLNARNVTGLADAPIALAINPGFKSTEGNDIREVFVLGVPQGAVLSAGINAGNGIYALTPDALRHLTITPPNHFQGNIVLTIVAADMEAENASQAGATVLETITVAAGTGEPGDDHKDGMGEADQRGAGQGGDDHHPTAPTLTVQRASGNEDAAIGLDIAAALGQPKNKTADQHDGGSARLSILVTGVPQGAALSAGTSIGNGVYLLSPAQLQGLTVTPPPEFTGTFQLTIAATAGPPEGEEDDGRSGSTSALLQVKVNPLAEAPVLSVHAENGNDDKTIPLAISASQAEPDLSAANLTVTVSGLNGATLNHGALNGNGSYTLKPADLAGLALTPTSQFNGVIALAVTATDSEPSSGTTATTAPQTLNILIVRGVAEDGYISGATVFADANSNGILDPGEASTTTDGTGHFTLVGGSGPLVLVGGTDTATLLPFTGTLRAPSGYSVVTPLTTLVNALLPANPGAADVTQAEQRVLAAFGITSSADLKTLDPEAGTQAGDATATAAFVAGTQVLDTAVMLASVISGTGTESFATAFDQVFGTLAGAVSTAAGQASRLDLSSTASVSSIVSAAAPTLAPILIEAATTAITASNAAIDQMTQTALTGAPLLTDLNAIATVAQGATAQALVRAGQNPTALSAPVAVDDLAAVTFNDQFNTFQTFSAATPSGWDTVGGPQWANDTRPQWTADGIPGRVIASGTLPFNNELQWYVNPSYVVPAGQPALPNPFNVSGGALHITAAPANPQIKNYFNAFDYSSGIITSYHSFQQLYGYFQITAQLPSGNGLLPAFWLLPADGSHAELDVMEVLGRDPTTLYTTVHSYSTGSLVSTGITTSVPNTSAGFHTYGVDWEPDNITWFFDGKQVFQTATPADLNKPMYMIANVAVGGAFPGNPDSTTPFPASMAITSVQSHHGYFVNQGTTLAVTAPQGVLANDTDADHDPLTAVLVHGPQHAQSFTLNPDGSLTYTPAANYSGSDSFTYKANDGLLDSNIATVSITINAATYTYTKLPDLGTINTKANSINDAGQIVGTYFGSAGPHGFLDSGGVSSTIDDPLAAFGTDANGINNAGQIVGTYFGSVGQHGFLDSGGVFTTIDDPLATAAIGTVANGINNAGQIVGAYSDSTGQHGFLDSGGIFTTIDDPLATFSTIANGINDAGQIVGTYRGSTGQHGFLDNGGVFTTIDDPLATGATVASGINDAGQIVGDFSEGQNIKLARHHGFLYQNGSYTTLDEQGARAINDRGQVIVGANDVANPQFIVNAAATVEPDPLYTTATVIFTAPTGTLILDQSTGFTGQISNLIGQDQIDLRDIAFGAHTTLLYSENNSNTGGILSVSDSVHTANLSLLGQYTTANFNMLSDSAGGTLVYDPPIANSDAQLSNSSSEAPTGLAAAGSLSAVIYAQPGANSFATLVPTSGQIWDPASALPEPSLVASQPAVYLGRLS